jgi:trans-aconitate methyltransferase
LGTGTGQVIAAIHRHFSDIIAVDPDPEMVKLAELTVSPAISPGTRLSFYTYRAEDFSPPPGWKASLVTICRAFHWMEQDRVLHRLAVCVPSTGVIAIFSDRSFWNADSPWQRAARQVIQDFLGEQRRAGAGVFSHPNRPYTEILEKSPFCKVEEVTIPVHRTWHAASILGYLYSTSFAARPLFGDRVGEFEAALKARLADYSDNDTFQEDNEFIIHFGRRG